MRQRDRVRKESLSRDEKSGQLEDRKQTRKKKTEAERGKDRVAKCQALNPNEIKEEEGKVKILALLNIQTRQKTALISAATTKLTQQYSFTERDGNY